MLPKSSPMKTVQNLIKKCSASVVLILFFHNLNAATFTSTKTGAWNDGQVWGFGGGGPWVQGTHYPGSSDAARINAGHTVTIPTGVNARAASVVVNFDGCNYSTALAFASSTARLTVSGNVSVNSYQAGAPGCLGVGSSTSRINLGQGTLTVGGTLTLKCSADISYTYNAGVDNNGGTLNVQGTIVFDIPIFPGVPEGLAYYSSGGNANSVLEFSGTSISYINQFPVSTPIIAGGSLILSRNGNQSMQEYFTSELHSLTLSGSGTKSINSESGFYVKNRLSLLGTSTLSLSASSPIIPNGFIKYTAASEIYYAYDDERTAGHELSKSFARTGATSYLTDTFPAITINGARKLHIPSGQSIKISGTFTISGGGVIHDDDAGCSNIFILDGASISGGSSSAYIYGCVGFENLPGSTSTTIPVGSASGYAPITIRPSNDAQWKVGAYDIADLSGGIAVADASRAVNHFWEFEDGGAAGAVNLTLGWARGNEGASFDANISNGIKIGHHNGTKWDEYTASFTDGGMRYADITGYNNGFSPFMVGAGPNSLPINLLHFTAKPEQNQVHLNWQTASEQNNDFFTLEKSKDAHNWTPFFDTTGAGNSNVLLSYSHIDKNPYEGYTYYRLKQTDYNGDYSYSNILDVYSHKTTSSISLYPNPANDKLFVEGLDQNSSVELYGSLGVLVPLRVLYDGELRILDVSGLAKGIYVLQADGLREMFIKE